MIQEFPNELIGVRASDLLGPRVFVKFHAIMFDAYVAIALIVDDVFDFEMVV